MAIIYAWRGELDQAFDWLELATSHERFRFNVYRILNAPELDSLRTDGRWDGLARRAEAVIENQGSPSE